MLSCRKNVLFIYFLSKSLIQSGPGVYVGTLNSIASIPGPSILLHILPNIFEDGTLVLVSLWPLILSF